MSVGSSDLSACCSWCRGPGLGRLAMLEAFAGLSTPLVADACVRCGVPLRAAPAGIRAVVAGQRVAGRVLPARHYGSVDVFLEALGRDGAGDVLVIDNGRGALWGSVSSPAGVGGRGGGAGALAPAGVGDPLASRVDIVFADDDGVVFVPAGQAGPVLAAARQIGEVERDQARRIREGQTLRQQTAFDDYLAQRAADPSLTFRQHLRRTGGAIEE